MRNGKPLTLYNKMGIVKVRTNIHGYTELQVKKINTLETKCLIETPELNILQNNENITKACK